MGEQTNLYKLQSYYIYKAQTEPEPWGAQDGNNLQSRFAWSYAAFESSNTAGGAGRGTLEKQDYTCVAGTTTACHTIPLWPSLLQGESHTRVKTLLVLPRPGSSGGAFGTGIRLCHHSCVTSSLLFTAIRWFLYSFPFVSASEQGKRIKCWWGVWGAENVPPRQENKDVLLPLAFHPGVGCRRMHKDKSGCRDEKDYEKLMTKGWQV